MLTKLDGLLALAVPYVVIGAVVAAFHLDFVRSLESDLAAHIPVFFDLIALGVTILMWPVVLVGSFAGVF